jgi:serine phosphatase RsbU (regulator of sigma subunit)
LVLVRFSEIKNNIKLRLLTGTVLLFFFFKLFFTYPDSAVYQVLNELFALVTAALLVFYLSDFFGRKKLNPLSLVMNIGILNAVIFFMIAFSESVFLTFDKYILSKINDPDLFTTLLSLLYSFLILTFVAYIFLAFREFYFLKQKRRVSLYFNTMVLFFVLAAFTSFLQNYKSLAFIQYTFYVISVILIVINSIRISWIAFITKKEKISLLILTVVIGVLFILNLVYNGEENVHRQVLTGFSASLEQFLNLVMLYGVIYFSVLFFTTLTHIPTAEAYDRKAREVSSLQYFSKLITQVLDFKELTETITDIALKVCGADAAWIVWPDNNEMKITGNRNVGYLDAGAITDFIFRNKLDDAGNGTKMIYLQKFNEAGSPGEKFNCIAIAYIKSHNQVKGYLIAAKKGDFIFDDEDKDALDTFSDYASVAVENSRLLEESIEKERLEKELDVAREVQRKILPAKNPENDKLSISSVFIPAFEVGGDYYDFFDTIPGQLGFVIADVSGKGISAAFIMAEIKGIFESLSKISASPREILIEANQILERTLERKNFVSAAYGLIDLSEEILYISRAGHCPVLLVRDGRAENLRPSGIGLGLNFGSHFANTLEEIKIDLKENDLIVLYTDGITEAQNKDLEEFGSRNFEQILIENCDNSVDEISNKVLKELTVFSQDNYQHDDITLLVLKWKQKTNKVSAGYQPVADGMER